MSFDGVARPLVDAGSSRFVLVGYLPTYAASALLLVLIWAGAPEPHLSFRQAWHTAAGLGVAEVALLAIAVTLVAVLLQPLQLAIVRVLEGGWPRRLGAGVARDWQLRRKGKAARLAQVYGAADIQTAGAAGARLRRRYPLPDDLVRPTALGNVLAAMEDTAGQAYRLDAVVAWPRLYPVLGDRMRAIVDDRRDALDGAARLGATGGVVAVASVALLARTGAWLALVLIPVVVAVVAYAGAVRAALAFAEAVEAAFDLHRFDLLKALHLELPSTSAAEQSVNEALCAQWRQGLPFDAGYRH